MTRFCPSCGRNIPPDARMCPYCGKTLAMHEGIIHNQQDVKQKNDKTLLIVILVVLILIIGIVAVSATIYVYVSGMNGPTPPQMTPNIGFTADKDAGTLRVTYVYTYSDEELRWSDFEITGNCDTSTLGIYVLQNDLITDCSGAITIIHTPTNSLIGTWTFTIS